MKQTIFTFLLLSTIGLISCRKTDIEKDIKQYDQEQIQGYISTNGITGLQRDLSGGDTTGIYYKTILPGNGVGYEYTDSISFVYTVKTFDGLYNSVDTIINHYSTYVGQLTKIGLPVGLQLMVKNVLKKGGSMRLLIPSRLAYGVKGAGSGSSSTVNTKIAGNQCLDYYIHAVNDQKAYDEDIMVKYIAANNLTGYQKAPIGLYYKIIKAGTGTVPITDNTTVNINYVGSLLNGTVFDSYATENNATGTTFDIPDMITGVREGAKSYCTTGSNVSFIIPSRLAYGRNGATKIPANSCIRFDMVVVSTTP
jgi:FKBP-type peptidyl-prolyl cis-trans isomerase FkpA